MLESLNKSLSNEDRQFSTKVYKASLRLKCLRKVYPRLFSGLTEFGIDKRSYSRPSFIDLKTEYEALSSSLTEKNLETLRTTAEVRFLKKAQTLSNKKIYTSIWIGSHCVDLFLPNVRSLTALYPQAVMRGLAIELNGDCHKYELKSKKDARKVNQLFALGIGVHYIDNWDLAEPLVTEITKLISGFRQLDSRERIRMWTRVYAFTLAIHLSNEDFFQIFKQKPTTLGGKHG